MKKYLLGAVAAVILAAPAVAQDSAQSTEHLDVWKRNKGITLGFITHQSLKDTESFIPYQYDSKFGFSLSVGTTYLWPRNSAGWAGNRIKVGVDARWFDISYAMYKKYPKVGGIQLSEEDYPSYDNGYGYEDDEEGFDLDSQQLHMGVGVGPGIVCVPFSSANSALRFLRVNLYAHFNPSVSALIYKDDQENLTASWAFVPSGDFGMNFQWKYFTLGFEGRWSSAKYNSLFSDDEEGWEEEEGGISFGGGKKQKFKNASFRICLGFRF